MTIVIDSPAALQAWSDEQRADRRIVALVPTMGALHRGHLALIEAARRRADVVIVSVFVNPLQFGEQADFDRYPRPIDDDLRCCEQAGVDVVYAPVAATMYPTGFATSVSVTELTEMMEGASRPGHFDGVTTVVTKLFAAARPHLAVFGEKDYQQLAIVRRMTRDLDLGIDIVAHPTVREADGLALSSRNQRLSARDREAAACIPAAIRGAIDAASLDSGGPAAIIEAATRIIESEPLATLDYVALFDADTLHAIDDRAWLERTASQVRIAIAASIGDVRLIDNASLHLA